MTNWPFDRRSTRTAAEVDDLTKAFMRRMLDKQEQAMPEPAAEDFASPQMQDAVETFTSTLDRMVGGNHYRELALQPWEIIDALDLDFYDGNALKYLLRWRKKGGVEDLKKAIHYIEHQIEKQEVKNVG